MNTESLDDEIYPRASIGHSVKGLLIFLVVFGHVIELSSNSLVSTIYSIIYVFHMPAFIFLSGWFSPEYSSKIKKRAIDYLKIYFLWSLAYGIFICALNGKLVFPNLLKPYWILWYVFSLSVWLWLKLLLIRISSKLVLVVAVFCSIAVGAIDSVDYNFSAQRIIYFFPFFVAGYFLRERDWSLFRDYAIDKKILLMAVIVITLTFVFLSNIQYFPRHLLYGSFAFSKMGFSLVLGSILRLFLLTYSFVVVVFFVILLNQVKFPILARVGKNTIGIFLMHGFVILILRYFQILDYENHIILIQSLLISLMTVLVFGNIKVSKFLKSFKLI